jgi:hypothetical protein
MEANALGAVNLQSSGSRPYRCSYDNVRGSASVTVESDADPRDVSGR